MAPPAVEKLQSLMNFIELHLNKPCGSFLFLIEYPGSTLAPPTPPTYKTNKYWHDSSTSTMCQVIFLILTSSWGLVAAPVQCALPRADRAGL